jgi:hypothetical protein
MGHCNFRAQHTRAALIGKTGRVLPSPNTLPPQDCHRVLKLGRVGCTVPDYWRRELNLGPNRPDTKSLSL